MNFTNNCESKLNVAEMILSQVLCEALSADVHPSGVLMVLSEMGGLPG